MGTFMKASLDAKIPIDYVDDIPEEATEIPHYNTTVISIIN